MTIDLFVTCPRGLEGVLAEELRPLGLEAAESTLGVTARGTLEGAYRACLWSRVANRVLLPVGRFAAEGEDALYAGVRGIRWREHLDPRGTLAVAFTGGGEAIRHTHFGALRTKDAIVDQLREETGTRPQVDTEQPDVRVHVHLHAGEATVSIDLSGESLHRRGWRGEAREAPLKENVAAGVLYLAGWPARAKEGAPFVDPMCGAGTLPIEAAMMAGDVAPGLDRARFGFEGWRGHDAGLWRRLREEAEARAVRDPARLPAVRGFDADAQAVKVARRNAARAKLDRVVAFAERPFDALGAEEAGGRPGVLVVNPPWGERLGEARELGALYQAIGDALKRRFPGWSAFVLTGSLALAKRIGLRPAKRHVLVSGGIECRLLDLPIAAEAPGEAEPAWRRPPPRTPGAEAFKNRLAKDLKHLRKWAKREDVRCFRVYDAELPEYAVAVDLYEDAAHVQEYECPPTVDPRAAERRLHDVMAVVPEVLGVRPEDVFLKVRRRQRGLEQYEKVGERRVVREVREGGHRFLVNLSDYLDTGLFLDHRSLRKLIGELAQGRRFLNLFAYTCSATVYAARGGAGATVSVDLSNTYLAWGAENLALNDLRGPAHTLVRADCLRWLGEGRDRFGLIFVAPPTYSRSKAAADFDLQRDHVALLQACAARLEPDGVILFSNHYRRFKLDAAALRGLRAEEITRRTLPPDFARSPRIHNSWKIVRA